MRWFVLSVLLLAPTTAFAQSATDRALFGPADSNVKGPPVPYRSVFAPAPQPTGSEEMPWRGANDEAGRLGGHIGQLQESDDAPTASRAGHEMHGAANAAPSQRMNSDDPN
jgi:hypothetical protein